jgi:hypothetical protein
MVGKLAYRLLSPAIALAEISKKQCVMSYGCTFLCNETFGSKNEWKRHENSQHSIWKHGAAAMRLLTRVFARRCTTFDSRSKIIWKRNII